MKIVTVKLVNMKQFGRVALVGSGEYLPAMTKFESELIAAGGSELFVQIPTAAGRESVSRISYWQELGMAQANRIGARQVFLPVFNRDDAMREDLAAMIDGAGLIYLSGGDPHYLASTLIGTPVYEAIIRNWKTGSSLAGCSAGAMVLGPDIPHFRKLKEEGDPGFNVIPNIRTIPHFNKFFKWIPDSAVQRFMKAPEHICIVGIDEMTAIYSDDLNNWSLVGQGKAHLLSGTSINILNYG